MIRQPADASTHNPKLTIVFWVVNHIPSGSWLPGGILFYVSVSRSGRKEATGAAK